MLCDAGLYEASLVPRGASFKIEHKMHVVAHNSPMLLNSIRSTAMHSQKKLGLFTGPFTYSGRRSFRSGATSGCHCARKVIAASSISPGRATTVCVDAVRTPHEPTTPCREDEGRAPDGLVLAFGGEEPRDDGEDGDEDDADEQTPATTVLADVSVIGASCAYPFAMVLLCWLCGCRSFVVDAAFSSRLAMRSSSSVISRERRICEPTPTSRHHLLKALFIHCTMSYAAHRSARRRGCIDEGPRKVCKKLHCVTISTMQDTEKQ